MKRDTISISDWLSLSSSQSFDEMLELSGQYMDTDIIIASAGTVKLILSSLYGERVAYPLYTSGEESVINPLSSAGKVTEYWNTWKAVQLPDFLRAFYALQLEYEPLDNYNGIEVKTITHGHTEATEHGKSTEVATDIYGFNESSARPSDSVTSTDSGTDTLRHGGVDTEELRRHGNLGVTTSQQMLNSEWELRKKNFVNEVIADFINIYTGY